ncbi:centriole and centriolar satellite protein ofd1 [Hoplias malabaricus]|uniref:centriole and centriolar satellite protein ofd1 n=1 Tax=Hoplias malabaricus TaxID=27720 RepID=UPI003461A701
MSEQKEETLSAEELRKRLYQTFRDRGLLDTLKTQLRNQLIQELQNPLAREPGPVPDKTGSLPLMASNSLVADHLQKCGYEYSLSVFLPESGTCRNKMLSSTDLLQLLRVSPHSSVYHTLVSKAQSGGKGLLINLLSDLIEHSLHPELHEAETQTSSSPTDFRRSLVEKLQMIDEEYEALRLRGSRWGSVEAKLMEFRKEMEEQAQVELKAKLQHFQEVEVSQVRREEQEKTRREIQTLRSHLEKTYEQKTEALTIRERNAIDRLQKQQEIQEKEMYAQRQSLLKEVESLRNRETELRHRTEAFEKMVKLQEEKVRSEEELLRRREISVRMMEETYEQKLSSEIQRFQQELREDQAQRTKELAENERRNKEETARLQKESSELEVKMEECEWMVSELRRLQGEVESLEAERGAVTRENAVLRERLEALSDYAVVRKERTELQAEVRLLKEHLEQKQLENQRLRQELRGPSQEHLALQAEVRRLETARKLEQEEFQNQRETLQTQLTQEVQRCAQVKTQLLECEERNHWMTVNTQEIKQQLTLTQKVLENEVLRNPKPSLVDVSALDLNRNKDVYVEAAVGFDEGDVCDAGPTTRGRRRSLRNRSSSPDTRTELVSEALARIRKLELEAESLEEAYRSYQQRAIRVNLAPDRTLAAFMRPPTAPHRVTFDPSAPPLSDVFPNRERPPPSRERAPPAVHSPPPRRLSSTPLSISKCKPPAADHNAAAGDRSLLTFTGLSPDRNVSPISPPAAAAVTVSSTEDTSFSAPCSPQMKSTARDQHSRPELQEVITSSQESSPKPETISVQDLTHPSAGDTQYTGDTLTHLRPALDSVIHRSEPAGLSPTSTKETEEKEKEGGQTQREEEEESKRQRENERRQREREEEDRRSREREEKEEEERERRRREREEEEEEEREKRQREREEEEEVERKRKEREEEEQQGTRRREREEHVVHEVINM